MASSRASAGEPPRAFTFSDKGNTNSRSLLSGPVPSASSASSTRAHRDTMREAAAQQENSKQRSSQPQVLPGVPARKSAPPPTKQTVSPSASATLSTSFLLNRRSSLLSRAGPKSRTARIGSAIWRVCFACQEQWLAVQLRSGRGGARAARAVLRRISVGRRFLLLCPCGHWQVRSGQGYYSAEV